MAAGAQSQRWIAAHRSRSAARWEADMDAPKKNPAEAGLGSVCRVEASGAGGFGALAVA